MVGAAGVAAVGTVVVAHNTGTVTAIILRQLMEAPTAQVVLETTSSQNLATPGAAQRIAYGTAGATGALA